MSPNDIYYKIDDRDKNAILEQLSRLAETYTPEWVFDSKNPDIGSVLALIFAGQLEENIGRLNLAVHKYRTEFVNMMNLNLRPAIPAHGFATMELVQDTIDGADVPKGTQLLADSDGDTRLIFETATDIHVTNAAITDAVAVSRSFGKLIPIYGSLVSAKYLNTAWREEDTTAAQSYELPPSMPSVMLPRFKLFDYGARGVERNGMVFLHEHIFNVPDKAVLQVRLSGMDGLAEDLSDENRYRWSFYTEDGFKSFDSVRLSSTGLLELHKTGEPKALQNDEKQYFAILVEAKTVIREKVIADMFEFSSHSANVEPEFVCHGEEDLVKDAFMPFGETAAIYDECYIGHNKLFAQKNARIRMSFELSYAEKTVSISAEEEQAELKVIMKKPRRVSYETAHTSAQRVNFEYFNGIGWVKLPMDGDFANVFEGKTSGHVEIAFTCPAELASAVAGGYEGLCLRMRVTQADNCYIQPCIHTMPVIKGLRLSHSYNGNWHVPTIVTRISGVDKTDLSRVIGGREPIELFMPLEFANNCLILGFNRPFLGTPISIYFEIAEHISFGLPAVRFMYSTRSQEGFRMLKVLDRTENFKHSGTITFVPPQDYSKSVHFGMERWWLRIDDEKNSYDDGDIGKIDINRVILNTVEIKNVETLPKEFFYIDTSQPNMTFPIAAQNILSAEVYVNEYSRLGADTMKHMEKEMPEMIRAEYDYTGELKEFYVKWDETDSFDISKPGDRHYIINRMDNTIVFGDGVNVAIPPSSADVSFTVQVTCCNGSEGNLPENIVTMPRNNLNFIGTINNYSPTFAGSDMEDTESALLRGANILSGSNRLVSEKDYERELMSWSRAISRVRCVCGVNAAGKKDPRAVTIVVLVKEYTKNAGVFSSMRDSIKEQLLKHSEMSVSADELQIIEPAFAEINVNVWATAESIEQSLEIQSKLSQKVESFLDPLTGGYDGNGWEIGSLPGELQLYMVLKAMQDDFAIDKLVMTCHCQDYSGGVETDIKKIRGNPFVVGINGKHTVVVTPNMS